MIDNSIVHYVASELMKRRGLEPGQQNQIRTLGWECFVRTTIQDKLDGFGTPISPVQREARALYEEVMRRSTNTFKKVKATIPTPMQH